ncbi:MAG TPA: hypothetical protein PLV59_02250 [Candidatus Dojkabacteria bacterium]|nr:hypothetical protein [Candidatus Dojkabacteria bacterium]
MNSLLQSGRTKYISLSNSNLQTIQRFKKEFGDLFYAHEAHLSFEIRENQDKGIFYLCDDLGIQNVIWRPLRENKTVGYNWPLLVELSSKYGKTQNQIVLNWMAHRGYKIEVMSKSPEHIKENWDATLFEMDDDDYQKMNEHRIDGYTYPKVDWNKTGEGISVSVLPDKFEENYVKP